MPNRNEEHHRVSRFCTCCIASTYSGSLLRKRIHVVRRKDERCDNFCEIDAKNYDKQTRALCTREWKSAAHSPCGKKENTEKRNEKMQGGGGEEEVEHAESNPTA